MSVHRVTALVLPGQSTFELASAAEVFGLRRPGLPHGYEFTVCTEHPGAVPTLAGYDMLVGADLTALDAADTVLVPGWHDRTQPAPPAVIDVLQRAHGRGARVVAICSATFLLAQAGLLSHRRATTHWRLAGELAARFPDVEVEPDTLYIDLGDVATSAGTAAGIDLCLHLARTDHGAAYAAHVARHMVMPPHREGGQLQYSTGAFADRQAESLAPLLDWATERLHQPLTLDALAAQARTSPRTLARRFADQLGVSPGRWLLQQRVAAARALLEETDLPVETVAQRVGLSSATNLRRRFHALVHTTPAAYRRSFGHREQGTGSHIRISRTSPRGTTPVSASSIG
ncbi:helix-turn-helix domain-containing protein [Streptomyces collinus]|uniref:AraC family transcriptional activator FtrA n=2 Tax=Streptomyces TaxID=1883 RepID=A0AA89QG46_STRCU|nr:helix-turn-helix domain-containing protein [Streptomyces collinus]MBB5816201.1 AraC family transcriptional activator FtrA [Streptomyces collinus]WMX69039.1 helix-turn-helix domain-containing protein [Streptomyces collinus]